MQAGRGKPRFGAAVWTLIVIGLGVAFGAAFAALRLARPPPAGVPLAEEVDIVLSTVGVVLLAALLAVYARTYSQTGAKFALGLIFVLIALLLQSALTSPLLFHAFGRGLGELGPFVLLADAFKTAAFTAFLYLSLQ